MSFDWSYILRVPTEARQAYSSWLLYTMSEDNAGAGVWAMRLSDLGWNAWIDEGDMPGLPRMGHWHAGPIEVGQRFVWAPFQYENAVLVEVTRIRPKAHNDERRMIFTRVLEYSPCYRVPLSRAMDETYNDESHFREMCVPVERLEYTLLEKAR